MSYFLTEVQTAARWMALQGRNAVAPAGDNMEGRERKDFDAYWDHEEQLARFKFQVKIFGQLKGLPLADSLIADFTVKDGIKNVPWEIRIGRGFVGVRPSNPSLDEDEGWTTLFRAVAPELLVEPTTTNALIEVSV